MTIAGLQVWFSGFEMYFAGVLFGVTATAGFALYYREQAEKMKSLLRGSDMSEPSTVDPLLDRIAELEAERDRLREALTWAVGFIRCNLPKTSQEYPDMRNAEELLAAVRPLMIGEFQLAMCRAEVAEAEVARLKGH